MSEFVYLNDRVLPAGEATVSVFDAGLTHAAGLFETMRAYHGRVMRINDHLERLLGSAATLDLLIPVTAAQLQHAVYEVLDANGLKDARIRLVVTPGNVPRPDQVEVVEPHPTILATATKVQPHPPEQYKTGWRVCISPYKTNRLDPLAGHKTLAYLPRLMAMKDAASRRCNESLWFTTENNLAEGSVCNVFVVKDGVIRTPPVNTPILPGTVRKAVIDEARDADIPVEETAIDITMLLEAQEVFLTGSVLEVMPVTSIEKHVVGDGQPGVVTRRVMELYAALVQSECGE
ncbi:MAG: aminotransferase class IV [Planctomycetes bacterium]|nr:aminotransferase class IV [Planctomycetota bacterium]